jgi:tRNA (cmo5U34)-methyltransferase
VSQKFDFNTIIDFDSHILKSIPNYDLLVETIMSMSEYFISKDANIYDLGCSTGKLLKSIPYNNKKIGYDCAKLMPSEDGDGVTFTSIDLNGFFEIKNACLVYSIFTMQFLNRESRQNYCDLVYKGLNEGGAFVLCEKIYQQDGLLQEILSFTHYDYKCNHFTEEEIIKKERDLRYIMKPNTLQANVQLLNIAGFTKITTFWQSYNFVGLIAIK